MLSVELQYFSFGMLSAIHSSMQDYNEYLKAQFGDLEINIVKHDDSFGGCPCVIVVQMGKNVKDKGTIAKDMSNYLYRMGLRFQSVPEYVGRGKTTAMRFYMSWSDVSPVLDNIKKAFGSKISGNVLPFEFQSLIIQNTARGVYARTA